MNRRTAFIATLAAAIARPADARTSNSDVLRQLIDEVIADGNLSNLDTLVAENVAIPKLGVSNIEQFGDVSIQGYNARKEAFTELDMSITSIADNGDYAHALVRFEGTLDNGRKQSDDVLYAAEFRDGLIVRFFLS